MLRMMRLHTKRIFVAILLLIIPAFCFFGIDMAFRDAGTGIAGKIYNKSIKIDKFSLAQQEARTQMFSQMIILFGVQSVDQLSQLRNRLSNYFTRENLNQLTWERLILLHLVKEQKIEVDRSEILRWVSNFPLFQQDGQFNSKRYESVLRNAFGLSSVVFEKHLKKSLQIQRLQNRTTGQIQPTDSEMRQAYTDQNEKVVIEFVLMDANQFGSELKFSDSETKAFYDLDPEQFRRPETIEAEYFVLKQEDLTEQVTISQDAIEAYYNANKTQFSDEKTELEKPLAEVQETIESILTNRAIEELFYEKTTDISIALIKQSPTDVAQEFGLELKKTDPFSLGQSPLPKKVTAALFTSEEQGYMQPIQVDTEVYLAQVVKRNPSKIPTFEECKDVVLKSLTLKRKIKLAQAQAQKKRAEIVAMIEKEPLPFAEAVKKAKLPIQKIPAFNRQDPLTILPKQVQNIAFQMKDNEVSQIIQTPNGALFFAVSEREVPEYKEDPQLIAKLRNQKQTQFYQLWLNRQKEAANLVDLTPFF